ncbi:unnamed protein product, partial [Staurois parvus]
MPVSATYQCCQSVPPISASLFPLSVPPISARRCCLSVPSVPPISARQCCLSVPSNSASHQCCLSLSVSAAYQFRLSVPPTSASSSVPISATCISVSITTASL